MASSKGLAAALDTLLYAGGSVGLAALTRALLVKSYKVMSESMEPALNVGDRILGERVTLRLHAPRRGDIVFFRDPDGSGDVLVKRVVATEGQVIDLLDGEVVIDGKPLDEPYASGRPTRSQAASVAYPHTVPAGRVWVMGDNRTHSHDSRSFGAVPLRDVEARAVCIYWPAGHVTSLATEARRPDEGGEADAR